MLTIQTFTFNLFQEHSFIISDELLNAIIIDPGFSSEEEKNQFINYIETNHLIPKILLNTHCHIDHVLGNEFIHKKYGLNVHLHAAEIFILEYCPKIADMYNIDYQPYTGEKILIQEHDTIQLNQHILKVIEVPGHSPGSLCFYNEEENFLIAGDTLFKDSIGRTDLPLADPETLLHSIKNKLWKLPNETVVYPGHGSTTTIGYEKKFNQYLL